MAYTKEERETIKGLESKLKPIMLVSVVFLSSFVYLVMYDKINLSKYGKTKATDLKDLPSKMTYVLQHLTPAVAWIMVSVFIVITRRVGSPAMNPLGGYEHRTEAARNNLTNTVEQTVMLAFAQLILITFIDSATILKVIPALNLLFILGRITFWLGYPKYRAFGFMVSSMPTYATIVYITYRFAKLYCNCI